MARQLTWQSHWLNRCFHRNSSIASQTWFWRPSRGKTVEVLSKLTTEVFEFHCNDPLDKSKPRPRSPGHFACDILSSPTIRRWIPLLKWWPWWTIKWSVYCQTGAHKKRNEKSWKHSDLNAINLCLSLVDTGPECRTWSLWRSQQCADTFMSFLQLIINTSGAKCWYGSQAFWSKFGGSQVWGWPGLMINGFESNVDWPPRLFALIGSRWHAPCWDNNDICFVQSQKAGNLSKKEVSKTTLG